MSLESLVVSKKRWFGHNSDPSRKAFHQDLFREAAGALIFSLETKYSRKSTTSASSGCVDLHLITSVSVDITLYHMTRAFYNQSTNTCSGYGMAIFLNCSSDIWLTHANQRQVFEKYSERKFIQKNLPLQWVSFNRTCALTLVCHNFQTFLSTL